MPRRKKIKLSDKAYDLIKRDLIECFWKPGEMIDEAATCNRLKIGRTPFREATTKLSAEGWIEVIAHRGYFAAPISPKYIRDIFELRAIIEPRAAYLACLRADESALSALERNVEESILLAASEDVSGSLQNSIEFHRLIAVLTGNKEMVDLIESLHSKITRAFVFLLKETPPLQPLNFHHQEILKAFRERDAEQALLAMEKDLKEAVKLLDADITRIS